MSSMGKVRPSGIFRGSFCSLFWSALCPTLSILPHSSSPCAWLPAVPAQSSRDVDIGGLGVSTSRDTVALVPEIPLSLDTTFFNYMGVSEKSGFSPQIIHLNRVFHYKPFLIGFSIIFTIHFGGFPRIFGNTQKGCSKMDSSRFFPWRKTRSFWQQIRRLDLLQTLFVDGHGSCNSIPDHFVDEFLAVSRFSVRLKLFEARTKETSQFAMGSISHMVC